MWRKKDKDNDVDSDSAGTSLADPGADEGSGLPNDGAVTDESVVKATSEQASGHRGEAGTEIDTDADREQRAEAFARDHDPEQHDVAAGDEFRQRGDWTADEHGGEQVQEPDGTVHDPGTEGAEEARAAAADSGSEKIRDGGHGWGSASPLESGAPPLGHPVKAWHDTLTYVLPGEDGYGADPHEWFVDGETAQQAGFRHAHGG